MARKKDDAVVVLDKDYLRDVSHADIEGISAKYNTDRTLVLHNSTIRNSGSCTPNKTCVFFVHGCEEGNGKVQKTVFKDVFSTYRPPNCECKFCHSDISFYGALTTKEFAEFADGQSHYGFRSHNKVKVNPMISLSKVPDKENTFVMRMFDVCFNYKCDSSDKKYYVTKTIEPKTALEIVPGESIKGYKILKKSIKEMPAFEAMNINSQTINSEFVRKFHFSDAHNLFDFLNKNKILFERTGFNIACKMLPYNMQRLRETPFFLFHLCLISEYPVMELLLKCGFSKLYFDLADSFLRSSSQVEILNKVNFFKKLFNTSSEGKNSLRIPAFIGNYLKEKAAPMSEYLTWCDIYELQSLSKEQFERFISSNEFMAASFNPVLQKMPGIIKYGYSIEKATRYLYKQSLNYAKRNTDGNWSSSHNRNMATLAQLMYDYLTMCEYLDVTRNDFPSDIRKAHDELVSLKKTKASDEHIPVLENVGTATQNLLDSFVDEEKLTKIEQDYFIKVPTNIQDFIEEGNLQNSCVGHYAQHVVNGERIVFFVRRKDEPDNSFITAEYVVSTETLGQCMYKNNRLVEDKELLNYCQVVCNRIKTGILAGKISF